MDIEKVLAKKTKYKKVAKELALGMKKVGVREQEHLRNAKLKVRSWFGLDPDEVIQYLETYEEKPEKEEVKEEKLDGS